MRAVLRNSDDLLRGIGRFDPRSPAVHLPTLLAIMVTFGPIYGAVMGAYGLDFGERLWQVLFSAIKVPLLLCATTILCLPAFFVLNTIAGLRDDFGHAVRAIVAGQAVLSIALAAMAPMTAWWYASASSYTVALLYNGIVFAIATLAGHLTMMRYYRPLIVRQPAHRGALVGWGVTYSFVGIQTAWMLRPFVGAPGLDVGFFRSEPFSNAYVFVAGMVADLFR
jgi:hypothetical protein